MGLHLRAQPPCRLANSNPRMLLNPRTAQPLCCHPRRLQGQGSRGRLGLQAASTPDSAGPAGHAAAGQAEEDADLCCVEPAAARCPTPPGVAPASDHLLGLDYGTCRYECDAEKGLIYGATVRFSDSAALRLRRRAVVMWDQETPKRVLIVKKPIPQAAQQLLDMAGWLQGRGIEVFVEQVVHESEFPQFQPFDPATTQVDFGITLGGDGTVLYLSALFDEDIPLPPVICFAMGTLGFLTPFDATDFRAHLARVLAANVRPLYCTLRTRKRCQVLNPYGQQLVEHHVMNECVIDRGAFPGAVCLELYVDGGFVTTVEADGLIIATPSGSTAYSMSAGGSMVAPSVPCTLLTPLSPHSLSFRPLVIPESSDIVVRVPPSARSHARVAFDGKRPMKLPKGCLIRFTSSLSPLPTINIGHLDFDWYQGITEKLKWNQVIRSKPLGMSVATPLEQVLESQGFSSLDGEEACLVAPEAWQDVTSSSDSGRGSGNGRLVAVDSLEEARPSTPNIGERDSAASKSVDLWCTSHYSEDAFYQ